MIRNTQNFIDLCRGEYGRKIAYTDVKEIDSTNIGIILSKTVGIHNHNRTLIRYLHRYYKGDQPINYRQKIVRPEINNRICENHALETVRFKVSQTYGEPIQYIGRKEEFNGDMDRLNDYMDDAFSRVRNIEVGTFQSSVGTAFKAVAKEDSWQEGSGLLPFSIHSLNPMNTYIVYSSRTGEAMVSVQCLKNSDGENYYLCYTPKEFFEVKDGMIIDHGINWFEHIPVIEYPNNAERMSDIEICITLFDSINTIQSNRIDGIEQFIQALMKFKNCQIDQNTFLEMVQLGAISVKDTCSGAQSDVELMTAELGQDQTQIAKDDIYRNMLIIEGMPDRQQNSGGDTGQAVYLRNGWDFAEKRALLDESFIEESEKRFAKVVLSVIKRTTKDVNVSVRDFDVKITRNPTDNMLVKSQALDYLIKNRINPKIAIATCGLFGDPEKVYAESREYIDRLYENKELKDRLKE